MLLPSAVPRKVGELAGAREPVMPGTKAGKEQRPTAANAMLMVLRDMMGGSSLEKICQPDNEEVFPLTFKMCDTDMEKSLLVVVTFTSPQLSLRCLSLTFLS